jgi:hypothetical protein
MMYRRDEDDDDDDVVDDDDDDNNNNNKYTDVAIPADRNVVQKEAENELKYKSLSIDIQRMWNMKFMIIPVITGDTGIVTEV